MRCSDPGCYWGSRSRRSSRRRSARSRIRSDEERELILAGQEPARTGGQVRAPWSTLIRSRDIWAIAGGYFCLLYIQYTFVSWLPSYLVQDRHMTVLKSGFATSIPWTRAFLVAIIFGRTSDVLMRRGWSCRPTEEHGRSPGISPVG